MASKKRVKTQFGEPAARSQGCARGSYSLFSAGSEPRLTAQTPVAADCPIAGPSLPRDWRFPSAAGRAATAGNRSAGAAGNRAMAASGPRRAPRSGSRSKGPCPGRRKAPTRCDILSSCPPFSRGSARVGERRGVSRHADHSPRNPQIRQRWFLFPYRTSRRKN
jgi:hypothetical protein